jgi:transcriptional regulator with XRE-family HTH domain
MGGTVKHEIPVRSSRHDAFGLAVRVRRVGRRLSQEELGAVAGMHRNYVGSVERGEQNPTLQTVFKLADGLHVTPSELLRLAEQNPAKPKALPKHRRRQAR